MNRYNRMNTAGRANTADTQNMNANNGSNGNDLLKRLQALAFAKVECELYLDAYPECAAALEYYQNLIDEYAKLVEIYENTVGPIRQESIKGDRWTWVDTPWPWQMNGEEKER